MNLKVGNESNRGDIYGLAVSPRAEFLHKRSWLLTNSNKTYPVTLSVGWVINAPYYYYISGFNAEFCVSPALAKVMSDMF